KALGVEQYNEGTKSLFRRWMPEKLLDEESVRKAIQAAKSPERNAKIALAKCGKPRPEHVRMALLKANIGRKITEATRRKLREAIKRQATLSPMLRGPLWSADEEALLGTMPDKDVAAQTGRSVKGVGEHRRKLGIPSFYK